MDTEIRTHRGQGLAKTEVENGVMHPQVKEPPGLLINTGKEEFFPRAFGGSPALLTP